MAQPPRRDAKLLDPEHGISEALYKKMVGWTKVVGVFTACLFVVSAFSDYFIWQQGNNTTIAQNDMREQSRAYVTFLGIIQLVNPQSPQSIQASQPPQPPQSGQTINYVFQSIFHNYGTTRTSKYSGWTSVKYFEKDVPNSQDFSKPYEAIPIIPANIGGNGDAFTLVALPAEDAIKAKNKQGVVIIWGHADWADIYHPDGVHPVNFCWKLIPARSDGDNNIMFQGTPYKPDCNTSMEAPRV
jgi:hypothetical protein